MAETSQVRRDADDASPPGATLPQEHFETLYAARADPWNLAEAWYERRKRAIVLACLPRERYQSGFEPACATGELTRLLAARCDRLLAADFARAAIRRACEAVSAHPGVEVQVGALPGEVRHRDCYDLVVASEFLYYFSASDLREVLDELTGRLEPDGDLVAVHHRARESGYGYDGFNVHRAVAARPELDPVLHHDDVDFVLDVWRRRP